jgi:hypothetical protein
MDKEKAKKATQTAVAAVFGLSTSAIQKWECPRNQDGSYNIPAVINWRVDSECEKRMPPDFDPDVATADTPAAERLRIIKGDILELDLGVKRKQLMARDDVREIMRTLCGLIRNATESLQREYGNDAADIIRDAINELEPEMERKFRTEEEK